MAYELNQAQKDWIAALRSGKYKQATGVLEDPKTHGFCCLGVGCNLFLADTRDAEFEDDWGEIRDEIYYGTGDTHDWETAPPELVEKLGLRGPSGNIDPSHIEVELPHRMSSSTIADSLADLNDLGWSFEQIADFIETYPEAVFRPVESQES